MLFSGIFTSDRTIDLSNHFRSEELSKRALSIEQRERTIKAARGKVYDRNGVVLADNQAVCSVSVIYYQIKEPEKVIRLFVTKACDF